jgi:hypothetical protein
VYVIHLDWADFIAQAQAGGSVFVESYQQPITAHGMQIGYKSFIASVRSVNRSPPRRRQSAPIVSLFEEPSWINSLSTC